MAPSVEQHVGQRVSYLARRAQHVKVVAIREHAPAAVEHPVGSTRETRADRFHAAREIVLAGGLDDQMDVIGLDRVVRRAEAAALARRGEASSELAHECYAAQRREPAAHFQRDVAREARRERAARPVRVARIRSALAPGSRPSAAPTGRRAQIESELSRLTPSPCHRAQCHRLV